MNKDIRMTENSIVVLGVLALFAALAIAAIALVYNRGLSIKATESSVEVATKPAAEAGDEIRQAEAHTPIEEKLR